MGIHPVPYDFAPFLNNVGDDWGPDADRLLAAWLQDIAPDRREWVDSIGRLAATLWKDMADFVERPENLPRLAGKGPYDNDPQQVVLPAETWDTLEEVHGSGIWQEDLDERARYAAVFLLNQNGEAGVACSVACTDGLMRVLRSVETPGPGHEILDALHGATAEHWLHGAQFVTEIQGGSDAGANAVQARGPDSEGAYALHGQKWFCSNLTADWWLVTARPRRAPAGTRGVGLFLVPRDQPGYTVERLKDKLGTRALPTAEMTFRGAKGWPVGPLDAGLRTMLEHVLVTSRIHNIIAAAAFLRRAVREVIAYAGFRTAFDQRLGDIPLVAEPLDRITHAADLAEAGAFRCVDLWLHARGAGSSPQRRPPMASAEEVAFARIMVSIAKAVSTRRLPGRIHEAMMIMGGNGIEERFTCLPRLYRDAAILETWEGPYTLLLDQAWRDSRRLAAGKEEAVLAVGLGDAAAPLAQRMRPLLEGDAPEAAWRHWCHDAMDAFEEEALARLGPAG